MSEFDVISIVEEFCSHSVYVESDGGNRLRHLIECTKPLALLLLDLFNTKNYDLTEVFLRKVYRFPEECDLFLQSEDLEKVYTVVGQLNENRKVQESFVQIILAADPALIPRNSSMIPLASLWIASDSLELSDASSQLIHKLVKANSNLLDPILGNIMHQVSSTKNDSTLHLRYLSLFSKIMSISSVYFRNCLTMGAVEEIVASCQKPDLLVQMISLEFLVDISSSSDGITYIFGRKYVHWLVAMGGGDGGTLYLDASLGHSVEELLVSQAIRCAAKVLRNAEQLAPDLLYDFLSGVARSSPLAEVCYRPCTSHPLLPVFVSGILHLLESTTEADRLTAIEALSIYATSSPRAYIQLLSSERLIVSWLDLLRQQPSVQASALHTVAQILLYPSLIRSDSGTEHALLQRHVNTLPAFNCLTKEELTSIMVELDALKRRIFGQMCVQLGTSKYQSTMQYLVKLAGGPIDELKHAAYDVLRSLAYQSQPWGIHTLFEHPGFYPFLLERSTEHDKAGKDWKFSLILSLHFSPHIDQLVAAIPERIQALVSEGAYHTPVEVAGPVTMEL